MWCPRLKHFARFNYDGTVSRCGHMIDAPVFSSIEEMDSSKWLANLTMQMSKDVWPVECGRCEQVEKVNQQSIRSHSLEHHKKETKSDYLHFGGVLDNICNSACQTCSQRLSTKIGSLQSKHYPIVDNSDKFWQLPLERIVQLDINGGEPSASKNYKRILANLPPNLQSLRVNTNAALMLNELLAVVDRGIKVTVTVSFDGIGKVHDYVRWPIDWERFKTNLLAYQDTGKFNLNLWTTVSALNINNLENIFEFAQQHNIDHSYAFLHYPTPLNIKYANTLTLHAKKRFEKNNKFGLDLISNLCAVDVNNQIEINQFIHDQDKLRNIHIQDFIDIQ
jgi:sulfatase maturation enzyme AslB (radical SAM superfamily)